MKKLAKVEMFIVRTLDATTTDGKVLPKRTAANVGAASKSQYTKEMIKSAKDARESLFKQVYLAVSETVAKHTTLKTMTAGERAKVSAQLYDADPLYSAYSYLGEFLDIIDVVGCFANPDKLDHWIKYFRGLFIFTCGLVFSVLKTTRTKLISCVTAIPTTRRCIGIGEWMRLGQSGWRLVASPKLVSTGRSLSQSTPSTTRANISSSHMPRSVPV